MKRYAIPLIAYTLVWAACGGSNPFAPTKHTPTEDIITPPAPPADRPEILMDNLNKAMNERDKDLYETIIDDRFWFTETDCAGELIWFNGKEEELEFIGGSRDGSTSGLFDRYRNFDFEFELISRSVELGAEYPIAFEGDPDGHPDEDWEVFRGRVKMLMVDENQDGFRVDQIMTYKLREAIEIVADSTDVEVDGTTEERLWKIARWVDDPLSGDCGNAGDTGDAKQVVPAFTGNPEQLTRTSSWSGLKERFN